MDELKLSNFIAMIPDCTMSNDERTLFDWLVFKCSYNFDWYRHSIPQVQAETRIRRKMQDKIISWFKELGFLEVQKTYYQNNPYRSFYVDFSVLSKEKVLQKLFSPGSETYTTMLSQFQKLAQEQKVHVKQSRSQRKREASIEAKRISELNEVQRVMDIVWSERIEMYNDGMLTEERPKRKRVVTKLHKSKPSKELIRKLLTSYEIDDIKNAFIAYVDDLLKGNVTTSHIVPYFLKYEKGDFPVFGKYLDLFATKYSCEQ